MWDIARTGSRRRTYSLGRGARRPRRRALGTLKLLVGLAIVGGAALGWLRLANLPREVVVYAIIDQESAQPLFDQFTRETGIRVKVTYASAGEKSVSAGQAFLLSLEDQPCDVLWDDELSTTLYWDLTTLYWDSWEPCEILSGAAYPARVRSPERKWYGFAAAARVLLVNRELVTDKETPSSLEQLVAPRWKGRVGFARPLRGTPLLHAAILNICWGGSQTAHFYRQLRDQGRVYATDERVAEAVARGEVACGLTDSRYALAAIKQGLPVRLAALDQQSFGMGMPLLPSTLAIVDSAPHLDEAQTLLEFLLRPESEALLARGALPRIPLHPQTPVADSPLAYDQYRWTPIDYRQLASCEQAGALVSALFEQAAPNR
jgi:iron(III) transport system substrate-binding protein